MKVDESIINALIEKMAVGKDEKYKEFIKKILINMSNGDEWDNLSKLDEINKKIKTDIKWYGFWSKKNMNSLPTIFKIIFALSIFGSLFSKQIPLQRVKTIPNIIFNNNVAYKVDEEIPYTGKISIWTENGIIKSEGLLRDGIKSGLWKEFFSSGQI